MNEPTINFRDYWPAAKIVAIPALIIMILLSLGAAFLTGPPVIHQEASVILVTATAEDAIRYVALLKTQVDASKIEAETLTGGVMRVTGLGATPAQAIEQASNGATALKLFADELRNSELTNQGLEVARYEGMPLAPAQYASVGVFNAGRAPNAVAVQAKDVRGRNATLIAFLTLVLAVLAVWSGGALRGKPLALQSEGSSD